MLTHGTRNKFEYPGYNFEAFEATVSSLVSEKCDEMSSKNFEDRLLWSELGLGLGQSNRNASRRELKYLRFNEFEDSENFTDSNSSSSGEESSTDEKRLIGTMQFLQQNIPSHLLLVSLLEQICILYDSNQERSKQLFQVLCQQLTAAKLLPRFAIFEEFQSIRDRYRTALTDLMELSISTVRQQQEEVRQWPIERSIEWRTSGSSLSDRPTNVKPSMMRTPSRYSEEFEEIDTLGKGGFGSVYEARNKLDGRNYAVKKISLAFVKADDCLKVLREVKVLAGLDHPNIVRYYSSWLEYGFTDISANGKFEDIMKENSHPGQRLQRHFSCGAGESQHSFSHLQSEDVSAASSDLIVFETNSETHACLKDADLLDPSSRKLFHANQNSSTKELGNHKLRLNGNFSNWQIPARSMFRDHRWCNKVALRRALSSHNLREYGNILRCPEQKLNNKVDQFEFKSLQITMHLQMELCSTTLKHWLVERNDRISHHGGAVDWSMNMNIFKQLLNGVHYIHNFSLIHRDLKPRNIFVNRQYGSEEVHVKIGDFGLARTDVFSRMKQNRYDSFDQFLHISNGISNSCTENATKGIGTLIYAAPEQLEKHSYSYKADIYSLGIILFELFSPFKTEMERLMSIKDLRQGNLPLTILERWPEESTFVLEMTTLKPDLRPEIKVILKSRFFEDKDKIIEMLKSDLIEKTKQMNELTELLRKKDKEIQEMKQRNTDK